MDGEIEFISCDEVLYEKMTHNAAASLLGFDENVKDENGYLARYKDGRKEWLSRDSFEVKYADYMFDKNPDALPKYLEVLEKERDILGVRINSIPYKMLPKQKQALISTQFRALCSYLLILRMEQRQGFVSNIPFEIALSALKDGFCIARHKWFEGEQRKIVFSQVSCRQGAEVIPNMKSLPTRAKELIMDDEDPTINYHDQCIAYNPNNGDATSWAPTIEDIFAFDWMVITANPKVAMKSVLSKKPITQ